MIGRTLSHYRIVESLGRGGMGEVYRAEDTLLGRTVALKFPHRHLVGDPRGRARFLGEARAASALDHPAIVVLYDVCEVQGEVFLAMQYVEGASLRERLAAGPAPAADALAWGRAVADALAHAHGRGVIHRDIKPENVLLAGDGRVKVADFGTARITWEPGLTRTGEITGSLPYVPPEAARAEVVDARGDLYALGVTLFEMCAGRPPFTGADPAAVLYQIVNQEAPELPAAPGVPAELRGLVRALLAKDPAARPASAIAVADALARMAEPHATAPAAPGAAPARSIAVLDFANLTGNPEDEYFAAGIAEDLFTDLLKIPDLKVASRSAVAALGARAANPRQAGRELGVATVLEGSVRRAGSRVRVTAQLTRTDSGYQVWAERYDRALEDVFEVQEDIARRIAEALRLALEPADAEGRQGRRTRSPRAYDLRLQALALYRRMEDGAMRRAIRLLEEALREDAEYALARADLAECMVQMICKAFDHDRGWLDRAEREVERALAQAPALAEGYRALGHLRNHRRQFGLALRDFHHALDLDPRFAGALTSLANNYLYLGDPSRAEVYARRAISLDAEDPRGAANLTASLLEQGRFDECRTVARRFLASVESPRYRGNLYGDLLLAAIRQGHSGELDRLTGEIERERERVLHPEPLLALAAAALGRADAARRWLAATPEGAIANNYVFVTRARVFAMLGERAAALAAIERAADMDAVNLAELRSDPLFSTLAGEPRFERIFTLQS